MQLGIILWSRILSWENGRRNIKSNVCSRNWCVIAIVASTLISSVVSMQLATVPRGPKGDKETRGHGSNWSNWSSRTAWIAGDTRHLGNSSEPACLYSAYADNIIEVNTIAPVLIDMAVMAVSVTPSKTSNLLIMSSVEALPGANKTIIICSRVGKPMADHNWLFCLQQ